MSEVTVSTLHLEASQGYHAPKARGKASENRKITTPLIFCLLLVHCSKNVSFLDFKNKSRKHTHELSNSQFGFIKGHSTELQLLRLTDDVTEQFNNGTSTLALFLDVEAAFDRCWHNGLIYKLHHNFPALRNYLYLLHNFLENRHFYVQVGHSSSRERVMRAGVPQGAIMSPFLYMLFTNDFPVDARCKVAMYADDTAIYNHVSALQKCNVI